MKRYLILLVLAATFFTPALQAQTDQRTTTTRIADLLAKVPANDAAQFERNMQAITEMGEKGIVEMATMLALPGKGDNTSLEYALAGFSGYVTKPGKETARNWAANAYVTALEKTADKENKSFIIRQLATTGTDASVTALKKYLTDDRLCDAAARALVKINTPAAQTALLDALQNATGNNQLTLIEALGDAKYTGAAKLIGGLANSADNKVSKLSLYALSQIADPSSEKVLADAAAKAGFVYETTGATTAYLTYAEQLTKNGKLAQAEKIANSVLKLAVQEKQVPARSVALQLLTVIKGEKSVPVLQAAMNDKNASYRKAALKYAAAFTSNSSIASWVKQLAKSNNTVKAEIITMLGNAGNTTALPVVLQALQTKDAGVQSAAIKAAGQIGQQQALPSLLNIIKKPTATTSEVENVTNAILIMKGADVTSQVAGAIAGTSSANAKASLVNILAARSADGFIKNVLPLVNSNDETVKVASYAALKTMVKADNLPQLFSLLTAAKTTQQVQDVQAAVVAATVTIPQQNAQTATIVNQMKQTPADKQYLFFDILAGIGGKEALGKVAGAFDGGNDQTKSAVVNSLSGWSNADAAAALLGIIRNPANASYLDKALTGYVQLIAKSGYTADRKFIQLREAMVVAKTNQQKQAILKEIEKCKTYNALVFAGTYLDDAVVQHEAAYAVMRIALSNKDWNGAAIRNLLAKATPLINGPDAAYEKQAIQKHLADMPQGEGFVSIFNGKDLTGWKGLVANPIERQKMDAAKLQAEQVKADDIMRKGWFVKDGELIFNIHGDNLCTIKKYGDFEMLVDWKITKDGDAGIYLRGTPQVQVWDTSRVDVGAQVGSGGLYNNAVNPSKPLKLADNAIGEWNTFRIIMKGDRVTVYLNGELVVNNTILENYWDRKLPIFSEEQIELQAHGSYVAYRDIYIKEIPRPKPFVLSDEEKKQNFKILFDGTNMHEWTGNMTDYIIEDGAIAVYPKNGGHGNLYTKDEYADFIYRFEFQLTPGANNGIGIRAPLEGDAAYEGMEIQVLDNEAEIYKNLHAYQYHGSVYGVIAAKRGFLKPTGEWNNEEIAIKGNKIKVTLNGTVILEGDIAEASKNGTIDGNQHPGLKRTKGHIGFLGHGDKVKFRNIRIAQL